MTSVLGRAKRNSQAAFQRQKKFHAIVAKRNQIRFNERLEKYWLWVGVLLFIRSAELLSDEVKVTQS